MQHIYVLISTFLQEQFPSFIDFNLFDKDRNNNVLTEIGTQKAINLQRKAMKCRSKDVIKWH